MASKIHKINTNNKPITPKKLIYLQIKHPQSMFSGFLTLILIEKNKSPDLISAERPFHTRQPRE